MIQYPFMQIGQRKIGIGYPCFIVAELSGNHQQDFRKAVDIIKAAAEAGADAIKLQTYTADTQTLDSHKEWFVVPPREETPESWRGESLYDLYKTAYTPWEWQPKLKELAESLGLILFSTPFDATAVDFLEQMNVPCYKVASYEATDIPLLKKIASKKKPVILSIGFASLEEVELAIKTLRENGVEEIAVLHCVTGYSGTPKPEEMNLQTVRDINDRFGVVSGFSDNNAGIEIGIIAAIAGASIIEKHVTLRRADEGVDALFSIEPNELKRMVTRIREAEQTLGTVHYGTASAAEEAHKRFRRSLWIAKDIKKGERFTPENVRVLKPEAGLAPKYYDEVLGKTASQDIERATPLTQELVE